AGHRRAARALPPLPHEPPLGRQRPQGPRRHYPRLVVDLPPQQGRQSRAVLALLPGQLLPRRDNGRGPHRRPPPPPAAARRPAGASAPPPPPPPPPPAAVRGVGGAGPFLGAAGRGHLALSPDLLPAVVLPRLGAELRRELP